MCQIYLPFLKEVNICLPIQGSNKKYFRRGDLVAKEKEEYVQKYGNSFIVKPDGQGPSRIAESESDGRFLASCGLSKISEI